MENTVGWDMGATGRGLDIERFIESLELLRRAYLLYAVVWIQALVFFPFILGMASFGGVAVVAVILVALAVFIGLIVAFFYYFRRGATLFSSVAGVDPRFRGFGKYWWVAVFGMAVVIIALLMLVLNPSVGGELGAVGLEIIAVALFLPMYRIGKAFGSSRVVAGSILLLIPLLAIIGGFLVFSGLGKEIKRMSKSS